MNKRLAYTGDRASQPLQHVAYFLGVRCVSNRPPFVVEVLESFECFDRLYVSTRLSTGDAIGVRLYGGDPQCALLGPDYRTVLEHHGVAHVYNHRSYMPPLRDQHQRMEERFTVLRLLTPLRISHEAAKKRAEPYTKIVEELPERRRDTVELVKEAVEEERKTYVLVNNRSEGNAPLTIQALRTALEAPDT